MTDTLEEDPPLPPGSAPPPVWRVWLQRVLMVVLLGFVGWNLTMIGWDRLFAKLPTSPWFYLLHVIAYIVLPVAELMVFGMIWRQPLPNALAAFLKKRALNAVVFGLSGEGYFYLWLRERLTVPPRRLIAGLKDNAILSAAANLVLTFVLVAVVLELKVDLPYVSDVGAGGVAALALALVGVLLILFRTELLHRIFWIDLPLAGRVLGVHLARLTIVLGLQMLQWEAGLPDGLWSLWFTLMATRLLLQHIPLIPNRELLFLAVVIQFSHTAGVDPVALQAMFAAVAVLGQLSNYAALVVTSFLPAANVVRSDPAVQR